MSQDFLKSMGHLALGSRLKRIGTLLQSATQASFYDDYCDAPAAQMPLLAALDRLGPLSVGELAQALGVAQPGVSRMAGALGDAGLIEPAPADESDRRVKRLRLTERGAALVDEAKRALWPKIEGTVAALCADLSGSLLEQLAGLERKLENGEFEREIARRAGAAQTERRNEAR